jgi:hypothetical protein
VRAALVTDWRDGFARTRIIVMQSRLSPER